MKRFSTNPSRLSFGVFALLVFLYAVVSLISFDGGQYVHGGNTIESKKQRSTNKTLFNETHFQVGNIIFPQLKNPQWHGDLMRGNDFVTLALSRERSKLKTTVCYFLFADRITFSVSDSGWSYELTRKRPMERFYQRALAHLQHTEKGWPALRLALKGNGFLPFIVDYQDVAGCKGNIMTLDSNRRLGVFTLAMPADPDCPIRLTLPNYFTLEALEIVNKVLSYKRYAPSWRRKRNKAVWRGTLNNGRHRWKLAQAAVRHRWLLDVGFTNVQADHRWRHLDEVGGLRPGMDMLHYADYKAILDVDGNSWSGRFGQLMCMDAVVIKVAPNDVDYFWPEIVPYHHFIPVSENMENLLDQVRWVIEHPIRSKEIVETANSWCREKLKMEVLVEDLLNIWDAYASLVVAPKPNDEIHDTLPNLNHFF